MRFLHWTTLAALFLSGAASAQTPPARFRPCLARYNLRLSPVWIRYIPAEGLLRLAPATQ